MIIIFNFISFFYSRHKNQTQTLLINKVVCLLADTKKALLKMTIGVHTNREETQWARKKSEQEKKSEHSFEMERIYRKTWINLIGAAFDSNMENVFNAHSILSA